MFNLGEKLAPKMHRHGGQASPEYADHVVLECLDGLLGKVAAMVVGGLSLYVILVSSIPVLYANDAWLLSIWCHGTMPHRAICASVQRWVRMSLPLLLFLSELLQEEFESTW
jgi:hypothetical protein